YSEAVPAFLCIIFMPLSYSISEGIVIGHLSYVFINLCCGRIKKVSVGMCALAAFFILRFFF
ncbi:MAG: NCS2 family permease, partial [Opitutales bacterium]|nr:NCS2 family permease [Opitutales bacterium]